MQTKLDEARKWAIVGFAFTLGSSILWLIVELFIMFSQLALISEFSWLAPEDMYLYEWKMDVIISGILWSAFAITGIVIAVIIWLAVIAPLKHGDYEKASKSLFPFLIIFTFVFGSILGGVFLVIAYLKINEHKTNLQFYAYQHYPPPQQPPYSQQNYAQPPPYPYALQQQQYQQPLGQHPPPGHQYQYTPPQPTYHQGSPICQKCNKPAQFDQKSQRWYCCGEWLLASSHVQTPQPQHQPYEQRPEQYTLPQPPSESQQPMPYPTPTTPLEHTKPAAMLFGFILLIIGTISFTIAVIMALFLTIYNPQAAYGIVISYFVGIVCIALSLLMKSEKTGLAGISFGIAIIFGCIGFIELIYGLLKLFGIFSPFFAGEYIVMGLSLVIPCGILMEVYEVLGKGDDEN